MEDARRGHDGDGDEEHGDGEEEHEQHRGDSGEDDGRASARDDEEDYYDSTSPGLSGAASRRGVPRRRSKSSQHLGGISPTPSDNSSSSSAARDDDDDEEEGNEDGRQSIDVQQELVHGAHKLEMQIEALESVLQSDDISASYVTTVKTTLRTLRKLVTKVVPPGVYARARADDLCDRPLLDQRRQDRLLPSRGSSNVREISGKKFYKEPARAGAILPDPPLKLERGAVKAKLESLEARITSRKPSDYDTLTLRKKIKVLQAMDLDTLRAVAEKSKCGCPLHDGGCFHMVACDFGVDKLSELRKGSILKDSVVEHHLIEKVELKAMMKKVDDNLKKARQIEDNDAAGAEWAFDYVIGGKCVCRAAFIWCTGIPMSTLGRKEAEVAEDSMRTAPSARQFMRSALKEMQQKDEATGKRDLAFAWSVEHISAMSELQPNPATDRDERHMDKYTRVCELCRAAVKKIRGVIDPETGVAGLCFTHSDEQQPVCLYGCYASAITSQLYPPNMLAKTTDFMEEFEAAKASMNVQHQRRNEKSPRPLLFYDFIPPSLRQFFSQVHERRHKGVSSDCLSCGKYHCAIHEARRDAGKMLQVKREYATHIAAVRRLRLADISKSLASTNSFKESGRMETLFSFIKGAYMHQMLDKGVSSVSK